MRCPILALLAQFYRLLDPASDPDAELRKKVRVFFRDYFQSKGARTDAEVERLVEEARHDPQGWLEATKPLFEAAHRDPHAWPQDLERLVRVSGEVWSDPGDLPPLSRPALMVWLGLESGREPSVIDEALGWEFRDLKVREGLAAWDEAADYRNRYGARRAPTSIFDAWAEVERRRGRDEHDLTLNACCAHLGVFEESDGKLHFDRIFDRLQRVADPELREATLAAALRSTRASGEA